MSSGGNGSSRPARGSTSLWRDTGFNVPTAKAIATGTDEDRAGYPGENTALRADMDPVHVFLGHDRPQITFRALFVGSLIGALMCFSNVLYGLQSGWVTMGSLSSSALGFGIFHLLRHRLLHFTPLENVLLQTTAVASATMPLAAGFVGIIPALGMLTKEEHKEGPVTLTTWEMIWWTTGVAFFGVFFGVPLRRQTILREKLKFPSGTATAEMIRVLHASTSETPPPAGASSLASIEATGTPWLRRRRPRGVRHGSMASTFDENCQVEDGSLLPNSGVALTGHGFAPSRPSSDAGRGKHSAGYSRSPRCVASESSSSSDLGSLSDATESLLSLRGLESDSVSSSPSDSPAVGSYGGDWESRFRILVWTFVISGAYTLLTHFVPVVGDMPIFTWVGWAAATEWGWILTPSPAYFAQGMIMGPRTGVSMLFGALLGWAVLGPVARQQKWAPGPISDNATGAKGWVVWVSLAIMLADSMTSLAIIIIQTAAKKFRQRRQARRAIMSGSISDDASAPVGRSAVTYQPFDGPVGTGNGDTGKIGLESTPLAASSTTPTQDDLSDDDLDPAAPHEQVPTSWWLGGLLVSSALCVAITSPIFHMPVYEPVVAIFLSLLVAVLAVRALGETDLNPVSGVGKLSQGAFAVVAPGNVVSNLLAGAIAEAGAQQAGDMMQDLKTGHLLLASPRAQFYAQLLGSALSIPFTVAAYKLFTSAYKVPGPMLQVPTAQIWLDMARVVTGGVVADHVVEFCVVFALISAAIPIASVFLPARVKPYLPSGIAVAVGMYVNPNWTIARFLGSVFQWYWHRKDAESHDRLMILVASGFVLGEGALATVNAILKTSGVDPLTCAGCVAGKCSGC